MMPKKRKSATAQLELPPEGATGHAASRKQSPVHPQHPNIVDAPPDAYGKAFVIGGIHSVKPKSRS
jgi:hypothetical protein